MNAVGKPLPSSDQFTEVALDLEPVPKFVRLAEERTKTDGHRRGNRKSSVDDFVDYPWGNADGASHGILRNSHGLEVFL